MVRKEVLLCDACGAEDAQQVVIIIGDVAYRGDLCEEHIAAIQPLLAYMRESAVPAGARSNHYETVGLEHLLGIIRADKGNHK